MGLTSDKLDQMPNMPSHTGKGTNDPSRNQSSGLPGTGDPGSNHQISQPVWFGITPSGNGILHPVAATASTAVAATNFILRITPLLAPYRLGSLQLHEPVRLCRNRRESGWRAENDHTSTSEVIREAVRRYLDVA